MSTWSNRMVINLAMVFLIGILSTEARISLNEIDREAFNPGPSPLDGEFEIVDLKEGAVSIPEGAPVLMLDGEWQMAEGGEEEQRLAGEWEDAIPAMVPGSVHSALLRAGRIPDPYFGMNAAIARAESYKTWWFKRTFDGCEALNNPTLTFGGVANSCTVWLNGSKLGAHEGMFGGPDFDISGLLQEKNTIIVRIDPVPMSFGRLAVPTSTGAMAQNSWMRMVTIKIFAGGHYVNLQPLGIWRSVKVKGAPDVRMVHPFVATRDAHTGEVDLVVELDGGHNLVGGKLVGVITPDNFEGRTFTLEHNVDSSESRKTVRLRMTVPEPRLWWPNNLGDPNLYALKLSFVPDNGGVPDTHEISFGIRTIEMQPWPEGNDPKEYDHKGKFDGFYDWIFVVNGRPMFVKGTGWCTMDPLLDFSRERYERLMVLARDQNIQMFRAWGNGMPETDEFYDLCNRYGIMVYQEWPNPADQPFEVMEDTVRRNMFRLRNNPALVLWGGGNELKDPFVPMIDMMGRYAFELDGTRNFHRTDPWGGNDHDYSLCWGRKPLDVGLSLTSAFWGEFGMRSLPNHESVLRYLPDDEKNVWPPPKGGSFEYHTPVFNREEKDMSRLRQFSGYFSEGRTMEEFIRGSQVASVTATRHTLELARTRWPASTGALYYKMNDCYPAASWACVDWYGAPKMNHYFFQQTFAPLHACLLFSTFDLSASTPPSELPVYLLDDADALENATWEVRVRAFDSDLKMVKEDSYKGRGAIERVRRIGTFTVGLPWASSNPLLFVVEVLREGEQANRTFYWTNFEAVKDSLFNLPKTQCSFKIVGDSVVITNNGTVPAVGVSIERPGHADTFHASENFVWLEPGESKVIKVNTAEGLNLEGWNL